jgi:hypothetical protein
MALNKKARFDSAGLDVPDDAGMINPTARHLLGYNSSPWKTAMDSVGLTTLGDPRGVPIEKLFID